MNSPYDILGVSPNATDDEIRKAYRELAKKYHPDNYADSPLKDTAEEKMAQINAAFDQIMARRRGGGQSAGQQSYGGYGGYQNSYQNASRFSDIRQMINQGRFEEAEEVLDGVASNARDGEWYFLKGSIFYQRGWMDDAFQYFSTACRMNPSNAEYRAALNRMQYQRQGGFGGGFGTDQNPYRTGQGQNATGCGICDICAGMACANLCCDCCGGGC